ncbi:formate dehydrogenase accessory sulfurtransferase FdhD [Virgibacillus halophilus]|uniref:formate dehydrogenase accessory sulfurtransferase FdhD n=1 Tax=Tigheibacillus halophilus TaxID=361280 RepID=UPI0036318A85
MDETVKYDWEIIHFNESSPILQDETIASENPLTVMINGMEFATMVCSPSNVKELIIGFLASEGIIHTFREIASIDIDIKQGFAYVEVTRPIDMAQVDHSKRFIGSCCGKSRQFYFKSDVKTAKTVLNQLVVSVAQCYTLMEKLQQASIYFKETGGVHNAALCSVKEIISIQTDIGRHNTLDKIYGDILIREIPLRDKLIVFSGRISSEVLLKISKMGIGILVSKSAPTDLALKLANDLGITVIGFVRGRKMNVYTHPKRIYEAIKTKQDQLSP